MDPSLAEPREHEVQGHGAFSTIIQERFEADAELVGQQVVLGSL